MDLWILFEWREKDKRDVKEENDDLVVVVVDRELVLDPIDVVSERNDA